MRQAEGPKTKGVERRNMDSNKVIGYMEFFGKVNAIVIKNGKVELEETKIERSDQCWKD